MRSPPVFLKEKPKSEPKDERYTTAGREMIAQSRNLRVQVLSLAAGEEIPWHHHTNVSDTFIYLDGPMLVETRNADGDHELSMGEPCSTASGAHLRIFGADHGV